MGPFFHKNKPHPWYHGQHVFLFLLPRCKILPPKKSLFVSFQASKEKESKEQTIYFQANAIKSFTSMTQRKCKIGKGISWEESIKGFF
jgi:hypothetical protein